MANSRVTTESIGPKKTSMLILITAIFLAILYLPGNEREDDFAKSAQIVAETLKFLGEEKLADRFLTDIRLKRVKVGKLGTAENATTGTNNLLGVGANEMTLDDAILVLGRSERLWKKKKYDSPLNYLAWAETIVHEYVHMDQKDPQNVPKFEDPAYLHIAQTHVRWFNRLNQLFETIAANEQDPQKKAIKLHGLRRILVSLDMLQGPFKEAVEKKIKDHSLNAHLKFANIGLDSRIGGTIRQIDAELKATETEIATAGKHKASPAVKNSKMDSTTGQTGWHREGPPAIEKAINKPDACYPSSTLDISDGVATGTREWRDCSNATKCSGTYVGKVTWTPPPAYMQPGKDVNFTATVGTTARNTCGSRNFGSWMVIKLNGGTFVQSGESQYSGPPKATGTFTALPGKSGDKLVIEVLLQASSLNGKVIYSYVYR
jgi:hypothetical protein